MMIAIAVLEVTAVLITAINLGVTAVNLAISRANRRTLREIHNYRARRDRPGAPEETR